MSWLKGLGDYIAWSVLGATAVVEGLIWGSAVAYYLTDDYWRRIKLQRAGLEYDKLKLQRKLDEEAPRQRAM